MSSKAKPADDELLQQLLLEPVKVESAPVVIPVIITETQEWVTIRGLEVEIADTFGFYSSIDWYAKSHKEPTGIPRNGRDYDHHGFVEKGHAETIPHYTSDRNAFRELEGMAIAFGIYDLYRQLLTEARLDEATAALEQKCVAMLKARKLQIRGKL